MYGCGRPLVAFPDLDEVDLEHKMALVRRDEDARRSLLLAGSETASLAFVPPRRGGQLEFALAVVPEARLTRSGGHFDAPVEVKLRRHADGGARRDTNLDVFDRVFNARLEADRPEGWTEVAIPLPVLEAPSRFELEVRVRASQASDGPLVAMTVPRFVPSRFETPPPSLLVVSLDTLRADRIGRVVNGRSITPRLDAFAAQSTVFRRASSTSSYTLPAHVSLFTGQHVTTHGMFHPSRRLHRERSPTFTELLAAAGYRTAAFTAGAMLNAEFCGLHRGFDEYSEADPMVSDCDPLPERVPRWYAPEYNAAVFAAHDLESRVLPWIEGRGGAPFFAFVHTYLVHDYHPDEEHHDLVQRPAMAKDLVPADAAPPLWEREAGATGVTSTTLTQLDPSDPGSFLRERDLPYVESLYDATVAQADAEFGRLLDSLERSGQADRTLVLVLSDHGEEFLEHGGLSHARTLYEEVLRVPCILRVPGREPAVVDERIDLADLAPTLLALLGMPALPRADGEVVLDGESDGWTVHHAQVLHAGAADRSGKVSLLRAAHDGRFKAIDTLKIDREVGDVDPAEQRRLELLGYAVGSGTADFVGTVDRSELYDLERDPGEDHDIPPDDPVTRERRRELEARLRGEPREEGP